MIKTQDKMSTDMVFQNPYFLDFLKLKDKYSEDDLEKAILSELGEFIQEFGTDFCFVARQKRISVGDTDYYLDLLFFHRRLIAIELKLDKFSPAHKGQMELYLRWLDKHERRLGEEKPLGIILCGEKSDQLVEFLELDKSGIHVAEYLTELPSRKLLEDKFQKAVTIAKEKIITRQELMKKKSF